MKLFALLLAVVLLALPATAAARERDVPRPGPLPAGALLDRLDDTVLQREARGMRAARAAAPNARSYATPDGYRVSVEASSSYSTDPTADQQLVDFLASRVHGPELGDLSVYVGTPPEISQLCGGDPSVVACYAIDEQRMYVPGESVRGIPIEYPLTHEYGHHVALWRSNAPWDALDWGAKYWSSSVDVCKQVQRHVLFPGNQGAHYWDDPGEGFADSYAHLHYPQAPWSYNDLMRPTRRTLAALQRDVLHPWSGPRYPYLPRPGRAAPPHAHLPHPAAPRRRPDDAPCRPARLRLRRPGRDPGLRGRPAAARRRRVRRAVVPPPARRPRRS